MIFETIKNGNKNSIKMSGKIFQEYSKINLDILILAKYNSTKDKQMFASSQ